MAIVQQLLWSPHYPKSVVVPDAVPSSKLKLPLANRLNHRCAVRSFTAPSATTSPFFFALPRLYIFVSNDV
jgi:hypothetical protein